MVYKGREVRSGGIIITLGDLSSLVRLLDGLDNTIEVISFKPGSKGIEQCLPDSDCFREKPRLV
jgi:hypothetical protein